MTANTVVSFFSRPHDKHWKQVEKERVVSTFSVLGSAFFINASRRQCKILAAVFRELAGEYPDEGRMLASWANRIDDIAHEPGRRPYYAHEIQAPA